MATNDKLVTQAFADKPQLLQDLNTFIDYYGQARAATNYQAPDLVPIVQDIARYVQELKAAGTTAQEEPAVKKRRLNGLESNGNSHGVKGTDTQPQPPTAILAATSKSNKTNSSDILTGTWDAPTQPVSFSVPQRKKYALQISPSKSHGIRALNLATQTPEFGIPWASVEHILRLPVPEKAAASHNFVVFPKGGDGLSGDKSPDGYETIVWGASDARKRGEEDVQTESEGLLGRLREVKARVVEPVESEFVSCVKHPMRKAERQYHVKAFRGSKEGYLFFLPTGIAFVFKKPLLFFAFDAIQSISYTSVLQRTFNLNVSALPSTAAADAPPMEIEFSMLDQADFAGIDEYIKRHKLQDASMAEARRAKKYNVNKDVDGDEENGGELQKAEQEANQAADDEDDEEDDENFDPGSEGESEGEGESSDEDEEGGDGGGDEGDEMDQDVVNEELGSEAEDVEEE